MSNEHINEAERMGRLARGCADPKVALVNAQLGTMHAVLALAATQAPRAGVDYDQHNELVAAYATLRRIVALHVTGATITGNRASAGAAGTALVDQLAIHEFDLSAEYEALNQLDPDDTAEETAAALARDGGRHEHQYQDFGPRAGRRCVTCNRPGFLDGSGEAGKDIPKDESTQPAEQFVPRTERSYWQTIADALNATSAAGIPVGIDIDGSLTDHHMWSVIWDRKAEQWAVAGYDDDRGSIEDVYSASELHEMDQAAEFQHDAAEEAYDSERGEGE